MPPHVTAVSKPLGNSAEPMSAILVLSMCCYTYRSAKRMRTTTVNKLTVGLRCLVSYCYHSACTSKHITDSEFPNGYQALLRKIRNPVPPDARVGHHFQ